MVFALSYLVDTNILLRVSNQADPQNRLAGTALTNLESQGVQLCYGLQNVAEFWNVCTRPANQNGVDLVVVWKEGHCALDELHTPVGF